MKLVRKIVNGLDLYLHFISFLFKFMVINKGRLFCLSMTVADNSTYKESPLGARLVVITLSLSAQRGEFLVMQASIMHF